MEKEVTVPVGVLRAVRDSLAQAQDSRVNAAFICGSLREAISTIIDRMDKGESKNETV